MQWEIELSDDDSITEYILLVNQVAAIITNEESYSDSELEIDSKQMRWEGSTISKAKNKDCGFNKAYWRIMRDYFSGDESICEEKDFKRRFCMSKAVFTMILSSILRTELFLKHTSRNRKPTIHTLCYLVGARRKFSYETWVNCNNKHHRILETTLNEALYEFCSIVVDNFSQEYLNRCLTAKEEKRCLDAMEKEIWKVALALRVASILLGIITISTKQEVTKGVVAIK